jgi:hypothetical protein
MPPSSGLAVAGNWPDQAVFWSNVSIFCQEVLVSDMNKMEEPTIYKLLSLKCVNIIQHPSFTYFHKVHKVCFLTFRFVSQDGFVASWAPQSGLRSRCVAPDDGEQPAAALGHRPQQASPKTLKLKVFLKKQTSCKSA